jgi:membrane protein DedA with SNARE-associated domain
VASYPWEVIEFATNLIENIGILGAGLFIAIESVVIPLPSEFVLLLSGFNVATGEFIFLPLLIATTAGSLIGALLLYGGGYGLSRHRLDALVIRFGRYVGMKIVDVNRAFDWFDRFGTWVILFGRLVPLIRSLVSIPAGLAKMRLSKFLLLTGIGSGIWNAIWIYIGMQLGERWKEAESWAKYLDYAAYALIALVFVSLISRVIRSRIII